MNYCRKESGTLTTRCTPLDTKKVGRPCEGCELMSGKDHIRIGDKTLYCSGGNCLSNNLIYGVQCLLCLIAYIGKTVQTLRNRISGHRGFMNKLDTSMNIEIDNDCTLAAHLIFDHGLRSKDDFNRVYKFYILRYVNNTEFLTTEEQRLINYFDTLKPKGLNVNNPVGLGINYLK